MMEPLRGSNCGLTYMSIMMEPLRGLIKQDVKKYNNHGSVPSFLLAKPLSFFTPQPPKGGLFIPYDKISLFEKMKSVNPDICQQLKDGTGFGTCYMSIMMEPAVQIGLTYMSIMMELLRGFNQAGCQKI